MKPQVGAEVNWMLVSPLTMITDGDLTKYFKGTIIGKRLPTYVR